MEQKENHKRIAMFSIHSDPLASLGSQESGGQNIYVRYLAEELGRLGWEVDIFTRLDNPRKNQIARISKNSRVIRLKGGPVGYVPKKELFSFLPEIFDNFLHFINFENPYILFHGHYWDGGAVALEAFKKFQKPFVQNFHSIGIVRVETKKRFLDNGSVDNSYVESRTEMEKEIIKNSSVIISLAESEKQSLIQFYGCPEEKVQVIRGGVDVKHWPLIEKEKARDTLSLDKKSFIILFVGRLEWRKGIGTMISASRLLREKIAGLKILIVGGKIFGRDINAADFKEYKRLQKKAEEEGVGDILSFAGSMDHGRLPAYYRSADVFVVPSYYEPFGLVVLEGMASKVPVIASSVGGLAITIKDGKTGLLFEPRNALSLQEKIMELYKSESLASVLVQNAFEEISKNYSWQNVTEKIAVIYNSLITGESK